MNFFTKMTLGSVAVLLAAVAAILLFRSRDAARVETLLLEAVGWVIKGDADRIAELIDNDFSYGPYDAEAARAEIRRYIHPGRYAKLILPTSVNVEIIGDDARAGLALRWDGPEAPPPLDPVSGPLVIVRLRKRDGHWKIIGFDWLGAHRR